MAGFASQDSWRQRVCSARRVTLILMGLLAVVTLSITVFGFVGSKYSTTLWKMQEDVKAINRTIAAELAAQQQNETNDLKTLQKIDQMVKNLTEEIKKGLVKGCCPRGWRLFQQSCYWLSSAQKSWNEAKQDCEDKQAQLVIITSRLEREFVFRFTKTHNVWIGLKFNGRTWKWLDGTPYTVQRSDWSPNQPVSYEQFCTKTYLNGLWSETYCQFRFRWLCEMQALQ
ncbi:asialoglycoprotein receptor 1-like isoform 2-T2 [Vipera latastei]